MADDEDDDEVAELLDVPDEDELVTEDELDEEVTDEEDDEFDEELVTLDELLLLVSSLTPPRRHRKCSSNAPAVNAAVVIWHLILRSAVSRIVLAAVPSGVMSVRPSIVRAVSPRMSFVAPAADSTFRPILPPPTSGSITCTTPSKMSVPAGRVTPRSYQPMAPPSSVNDHRATMSPSGFHFLSLAS